MWDAATYLKFSDERSRPFADLMSQVRTAEPEWIIDLGCGTGALAKTLSERWPGARVVGVDSSKEMLSQATPLAIPGRLEYEQADIATWSTQRPLDLVVSNAALQWVNDHDGVLTRLAKMLVPGGTLAVQMPDRSHTPSQVAVEDAVADPRWSSTLQNVGLHRKSVEPLAWYVHHLHDLGFKVNAWETTYYHILTGENPVLEWLKGTALRPLLACLRGEQTEEFLRVLGSRLKDAYPAREGITVFPMPRVFFVATR
ncbi:methyltransferase domain-containing protein [Fimbriiglobus ruber]|nr:methyltransferase domain-containing protein [Fimbriiglobus ruber]